jgi:hypothetical protein
MQTSTKTKTIPHFQINDTILVKGKLKAIIIHYGDELEEIEHDFDNSFFEIEKVINKNNYYYYDISEVNCRDTYLIAKNVPQSYLRHSDCRQMFSSRQTVLVTGKITYTMEDYSNSPLTKYFNKEKFTISEVIPDINGMHKYNLRNVEDDRLYLDNIGESYLSKIQNDY